MCSSDLESPRRRGRFDLPGAITGTGGIAALVYGLSTGSFSRQHRRRASRRRGHVGSPLTLAIISLALGVPISAIAVAAGTHAAGVMGLVAIARH